ncbi:MAG: ABC transporter ATP-binding protein [Myxococcales bacterium]
MTAAIEVDQVTRSFGSVQAVRGISFSVPRGQIRGYLGPNGAGKSTTLKMLSGLLAPSSGAVRIAGLDPTRAPLEVKRKLGFVPESGALFGLLTAREHLELVADLHELPAAQAKARSGELLSMFALENLAGRRIDKLSKGQKQKVALATALLHEPEVLLLDEPLNGLDVESARAFKELMQQTVARGGTVLFSSHILDVVERLCHRAIILHQGAVVADAPTAELVARSKDKSLESVFHELVTSEKAAGAQGAAGAETKPC